MSQRRRGPIVNIIRYGLLGIVTAIVVAVATALIEPSGMISGQFTSQTTYHVLEHNLWSRHTVVYWVWPIDLATAADTYDPAADYKQARAGLRWLELQPVEDEVERIGYAEAVGVPFRCLRYDDQRGAGPFPGPTHPEVNVPFVGLRTIPLEPIPAGLAANTTIYAAVWWLLAVYVRRTRAHNRRLHGRCPTCGYDLTALDAPECPECGHPRAPAIVCDEPQPAHD
ncbi:MAG: hypothetical protein CMJ31_07470 [Phycisphaerae bacterium]|nr:hypothetical protein [Phycisphaerae bacterium]